MKNLTILLIMFALSLSAQENFEPQFEKQGDIIKSIFYHDN